MFALDAPTAAAKTPAPSPQASPPTARRNLVLLLLAGACLGVMTGIYETSFNNYLSEEFQLSANARGLLELPREMPGFLVALSAGLLSGWRNSRAGAAALAAVAVGLFGLGRLSPEFWSMVVWLTIWSIGVHLYIPLESSLALATAGKGHGGERLGQLEGLKTAAVIVGAALVWIGTDYISSGFTGLYTTGAIVIGLGALFLWGMKTPPAVKNKQPLSRRLIFRRSYGLYYLLCVLYGARKQVFLTFGPWLLIRVLGEPASTIAKLWIVASVLGVLFRPALGRLIDLAGERLVLMADAVLVFFICLGYGLAPTLGWGVWGTRLAYACYVADLMLAATTMARTMYLYHIIERPDDLTPSLSMGVSIDHAVAMTIPMFAGLLWVSFGYTAVFLAAAGITILNLVAAAFIKVGKPADLPGPAAAGG
ncbi:MAG TPA: MFS transporter [Firmicutes bacterium]|nr:MFS transporter [Bacillota bacterium]